MQFRYAQFPFVPSLWKAGDRWRILGAIRLLTQDKRSSLPPAEHAIVRRFDYATGAARNGKVKSRQQFCRYKALARASENPRYFFGPLACNWSPRGSKSLSAIRSVRFGGFRSAASGATAGSPQSHFESAPREIEGPYVRPSLMWRHERRESLSTERSEGNLVCVPASNRESKKIIGLTQGRNSASDLIHELGMKFLLLSPVRLSARIRFLAIDEDSFKIRSASVIE